MLLHSYGARVRRAFYRVWPFGSLPEVHDSPRYTTLSDDEVVDAFASALVAAREADGSEAVSEKLDDSWSYRAEWRRRGNEMGELYAAGEERLSEHGYSADMTRFK